MFFYEQQYFISDLTVSVELWRGFRQPLLDVVHLRDGVLWKLLPVVDVIVLQKSQDFNSLKTQNALGYKPSSILSSLSLVRTSSCCASSTLGQFWCLSNTVLIGQCVTLFCLRWFPLPLVTWRHLWPTITLQLSDVRNRKRRQWRHLHRVIGKIWLLHIMAIIGPLSCFLTAFNCKKWDLSIFLQFSCLSTETNWTTELIWIFWWIHDEGEGFTQRQNPA